jgi:hypothetical protein
MIDYFESKDSLHLSLHTEGGCILACMKEAEFNELVREWEERTPEALVPRCFVPNPSGYTQVWTGKASPVTDGTAGDPIELSAFFDWLPRPRIRFFQDVNQFAEDSLGAKLFAALELGKSEFEIDGSRLDVLWTSSNSDRGKEGVLSGKWEVSANTNFRSVDFLLANFPNVLGSPVRHGKSSVSGRITLVDPLWSVTIDPVESCGAILKEARAVGGYAITHVGRVERLDGSSFSPAETEELIEVLRRFFCFVGTRHHGPLFPTGFNERSELVHRQYQAPQIDFAQPGFNWFSRTHGHWLEVLWPTFLASLSADREAGDLKRAIYYYVQSQDMGQDTGLIVAAAALELLAWRYLYLNNRVISKQGFESLPAADVWRLMFAGMNINPAIPASLRELLAFHDNQEVKTPGISPVVTVVQIRNKLVHPDKDKTLSGKGNVLFEAWVLCSQWLELVLLHEFGYQGDFQDRTALGDSSQTASVPWTNRVG